MESRQEIEQMRVVELREFLRRHDVSIKNVARSDGTPGPPRKPELLKAALDVWEDYNFAQSQTPEQPSNPFQSRRSPASLQRARRSSTAQQQDMNQTPRTSSRAPRPSADRVSGAEDEPREPTADAALNARQRRRSSSWVDPSLLAQLRAPSQTNAKEKSNSRPSSRARSSSVAGAAQRKRETLDSDEIRKESAPSVARGATRSESTHPETPSTVHRRTRQRNTSTAASTPSVRAPLLLDIDENYVSDQDPDYEADDEPVDDEDDSDANEQEHDKPAQVVDLTRDSTSRQQRQALRDSDDGIQPFHNYESSRGKEEVVEEDIPFDSDAYESDRAHHSDRGSVLDTEDDEQLVDFSKWSTRDIRDWLRAHNVPFTSFASKEELIGLVRAKILQMETIEEEDPVPNVQTHSARLSRKPEESNLARRRGISIPSVVDEDDEVIFVQQQIRRKSNRKNPKGIDSKEYTKNASRRNNRRLLAVSLLLICLPALVILWVYAIQSLLMSSTIPFCDKDAPSNYTISGDLCRRCPRNGVCSDGFLFCESGFVRSGAKCVRDEVFKRLVEHLVDHAYHNLSELAGRAECGEPVPTTLTYEELGSLLTSHFYQTRKADPSFFRAVSDEDQVLETAVFKALDVLSEDHSGVYLAPDNTFGSFHPRFSFKCKLKRKVKEHIFEILSVVILFLLLLFVRVKIYLIRLRQRQCEAAHQKSLEVLRDQVVGFRNNEEDVAFVSDVMLREEVLGRPTKQVIKLWKDVEEILKSDPRVLRKHQTIRGMPSYTYEYVGSRRSSGSVFDSLSRRSSSFGSRASLDSLDLRSDADFDVTPRRTVGSYVMSFLDGR